MSFCCCVLKNWRKQGNLCLCVPIYILSGVTEINTNTLKHIYLFLQIFFQVFFLFLTWSSSFRSDVNLCQSSSMNSVKDLVFQWWRQKNPSFTLEPFAKLSECVLISVTCRCKMKNPQQWWCKEFEKRSCKTVEKRACSRTMRGQMKTRSYFLILRESWRETVNDGEQVFMSCLRLTESVSFLLSSQAQVV